MLKQDVVQCNMCMHTLTGTEIQCETTENDYNFNMNWPQNYFTASSENTYNTNALLCTTDIHTPIKATYFRKTDSKSLIIISTIPFCTGMSIAISIESISALISVGPNTIATLEACILLI